MSGDRVDLTRNDPGARGLNLNCLKMKKLLIDVSFIILNYAHVTL